MVAGGALADESGDLASQCGLLLTGSATQEMPLVCGEYTLHARPTSLWKHCFLRTAALMPMASPCHSLPEHLSWLQEEAAPKVGLARNAGKFKLPRATLNKRQIRVGGEDPGLLSLGQDDSEDMCSTCPGAPWRHEPQLLMVAPAPGAPCILSLPSLAHIPTGASWDPSQMNSLHSDPCFRLCFLGSHTHLGSQVIYLSVMGSPVWKGLQPSPATTPLLSRKHDGGPERRNC